MLIAALLTTTHGWADTPPDATGLAGAIGSNATHAVVQERVAAQAVENALATRNDAETAFVAALMNEGEDAVSLARDRLKQCDRQARDVLAQLEEVTRMRASMQAAVAAASDLLAKLADETNERRRRSAVKSLTALAETNRDLLADLERLVSELKDRWLVPAIGKTAAASREAGEKGPP